MEEPILPTRKGFLKRALLACAGVASVAGFTTASGKSSRSGFMSAGRPSMPRIRTAARAVVHKSVR